MTHQLRLGLVPGYLLLCLVFGGASGGGYWANMGLQLLALPIIAWALLTPRSGQTPASARQLLLILLMAILIVLLQLVPLPPALWTKLGGREDIARGFALLGQPLPWLPTSLAPHRTISSALWTLPGIAILLGMLRLGAFKPTLLAWTLVLVTGAGIGLGFLQLAGGEDSPLYFYQITNRGTATGFFANTNNMAELMVVTIPFVAALYLAALGRGRSLQKSSGLFVVLAGALAVLLVGIAVNGSLAAVGLMIPAVAAAALMMVYRKERAPVWTAAVVAALLGASVTAVLTTPFQDTATTATTQSTVATRYDAAATTAAAAKKYLLLGSGLGTFPRIYDNYEDPGAVDRWYMNHAHNDYLELALETGLPGIALILLFLLWWIGRVFAVWRAEEPDHFARAATVGSAIILMHSLVEFPLRTAAIAALFAMSCALMSQPRPQSKQVSSDERRGAARHLTA